MSQKDRTVPKDWIQAFACLREYIEELPKDERVFLEPFTSGQTREYLCEHGFMWSEYTSETLILVPVRSSAVFSF